MEREGGGEVRTTGELIVSSGLEMDGIDWIKFS